MPAICYWCSIKGTSVISNPLGKQDHPFGCCYNCHVLACGYHAVRDNAAKEFVCFDCDKNNLCKMVANIAGVADNSFTVRISISPHDILLKLLKELGLSGQLILPQNFPTDVSTFYEQRPGYKVWFDKFQVNDFSNQSFTSQLINSGVAYDTRLVLEELPYHAKGLLIAAAIITDHMYTGSLREEQPELLLDLAKALHKLQK
ncbi:hypothetical protein [Chitinophaga sp.]|uniref:hypothetical protein n=1 Tax=Chitinophaga sp. TaxID=1869181 RepID=UPI0031DDC447